MVATGEKQKNESASSELDTEVESAAWSPFYCM
jgi:hypothetical protein